MATPRDVDSRLLRALRAVPPDAVLVPSVLAASLGVDETSLGERISGLRIAGYVIDTAAGSCRLIAAPTRLIADDLCAALPGDTEGVGRQILVFEETDSTNDLAASAGRDGVPGGLVIFAESQRAGRGRLGRQWTAPAYQALLFSVLLRPEHVPADRWPELTFCAALAVAQTAEELTGTAARIKWPNDVLIAGHKVAGILLERHHAPPGGFVVVGIGLNVLQKQENFPPELRDRAGSLAMFTRLSPDPERRLAAAMVLQRLDTLFARWPEDFSAIMAQCAQRGCTPPSGETTSVAL